MPCSNGKNALHYIERGIRTNRGRHQDEENVKNIHNIEALMYMIENQDVRQYGVCRLGSQSFLPWE